MTFVGSKGQEGVFQAIINLIPPHRIYVEPFAGLLAIGRKKRPAEKNIALDEERNDALQVPPWFEFRVGCGLEFLETRTWAGDEFVYADPPYMLSTRGGRRYYNNEFTDADHVRLLAVLVKLPVPVLLSSYASDLYRDTLKEWNLREVVAHTRNHSTRTECLWFNYPEPTILHEYTSAGVNFRERDRIKKKVRRWKARLALQPAEERAALFSSLVDVMGPDAVRAHLARNAESVTELGETSAGATRSDTSPLRATQSDTSTLRATRPHSSTPGATRPHSSTPGVTGRSPVMPAASRGVLSLFPGVDLLGKGFERAGFWVARGPDVIWGGDVREFFPEAGGFVGVIGGPPCPDFSKARRGAPTGYGVQMLAEFARVVSAVLPTWALMENVPGVPDVEIPGFSRQRINLDALECGGTQRRLRTFQFFSRDNSRLCIRRTKKPEIREKTCLALEGSRPGRRGWGDFCALQGLPRETEFPGLTLSAKYRAVGNGVPVFMAETLARAILDREPDGRRRLCACDCGREIFGTAVAGGSACRKRLERARNRAREAATCSGPTALRPEVCRDVD